VVGAVAFCMFLEKINDLFYQTKQIFAIEESTKIQKNWKDRHPLFSKEGACIDGKDMILW
jgi:hypothetical protein